MERRQEGRKSERVKQNPLRDLNKGLIEGIDWVSQ